MKLRPTELSGDHLISQVNVSYDTLTGTLRGMNYQVTPNEEAKVIRCPRGAIFDVIVDVRANSPSRLRWFGTELNATNRRMLYVLEGFAHGFQTLEDNTEVLHLMSTYLDDAAARGIGYDDPSVGNDWPLEPTAISRRDTKWSDVDPIRYVV